MFREIDDFTIRTREPLYTDVLNFWNNKRYISGFVHVSKVAEIILSIPATQVSVERSFSALQFILNENWSKLTEGNLQNLLIVRLNT